MTHNKSDEPLPIDLIFDAVVAALDAGLSDDEIRDEVELALECWKEARDV